MNTLNNLLLINVYQRMHANTNTISVSEIDQSVLPEFWVQLSIYIYTQSYKMIDKWGPLHIAITGNWIHTEISVLVAS